MELPNFDYEFIAWNKGHRFVAGCDEVGRGCLAGPVVAGAVVFNNRPMSANIKIKIDDSKKLNAKEREIADKWIKKNAIAHGVGIASVSVINKLGIKKASEIAFRKAITALNLKLDYLLMDAFYVPYVRGLRRKKQLAIVKGDTKSFSIASASIVAKVYRDSLMKDLGDKSKYKNYLWWKNKGYGTKEHQSAILKYGVTSVHRRDFVNTFLANNLRPKTSS